MTQRKKVLFFYLLRNSYYLGIFSGSQGPHPVTGVVESLPTSMVCSQRTEIPIGEGWMLQTKSKEAQEKRFWNDCDFHRKIWGNDFSLKKKKEEIIKVELFGSSGKKVLGLWWASWGGLSGQMFSWLALWEPRGWGHQGVSRRSVLWFWFWEWGNMMSVWGMEPYRICSEGVGGREASCSPD